MAAEYFTHTIFTKQEFDSLVDHRAGEIKLGEKMTLYSKEDNNWKTCRFHILGVMESIGPRLNKGLSGAEKGFAPFLSRFVNVQSNAFLSGEGVCFHGTFEPAENIDSISSEQIEVLDEMIKAWTLKVLEAGGIPIVVGGGHNNALGLINGVSGHFGKPISVVNLDPHADVRATGERHSGNSFSTAFEKRTMSSYYVLGLHQSYNNQFILDKLKAMNAWASWFEDWVDDSSQFQSDVIAVAQQVESDHFGLELDMDSIAFMPASAYTPSGITVEQARYYVRHLASLKNVCYLHLPEAAPSSYKEDKMVGKTLTYLVTDFIKCHSNVPD